MDQMIEQKRISKKYFFLNSRSKKELIKSPG